MRLARLLQAPLMPSGIHTLPVQQQPIAAAGAQGAPNGRIPKPARGLPLPPQSLPRQQPARAVLATNQPS